MKSRNLLFLSLLSCFAAVPAYANWEYSGYYVGDGAYTDDGSRFTISFRGGASFGYGVIQNDIGELTPLYYIDANQTNIMPQLAYEQCIMGSNPEACVGYTAAGYINVGDLSPTKNFESFSVAAGVSLGWTIPYSPQWRIEAGWDHIAESQYNSSPFLEGEAELFGGPAAGLIALVPSGDVKSTVSTDIISVMAYYDFYDGIQKPARTVIPYVGLGVGYADVKTVLNLSDPYGDLSSTYLDEFGQRLGDKPELSVINFYQSETDNPNIAVLAALGLSYGITDSLFFDIGARVAYVPTIKWTLTNADGSVHRDWFSANNTIYATLMLGIRFEF